MEGNVAQAIEIGAVLPPWSALPFVGMLLSIACLPLAAPAFWHRHYPRIALGWATLFALPFLWAYGHVAVETLLHVALADYLPFLILITTLFTIGGGIHVSSSLRGTPATNAVLLASGAALASLVGTTGASMIMIRPVLRANRTRRHRTHTVVFFIFLVANVGGSLTPLGDPPLFLGFLHGVPFWWTLRLWREVLFAVIALLAVYVALDAWYWRREDGAVRAAAVALPRRTTIEGGVNLVLLAGVLAAIVGSGLWHGPPVALLGVRESTSDALRDLVLLGLLALSLRLTPPGVRERNEFTWTPVREVAVLFAGIFVTMVPAVGMLRAGEHGPLAALVRAIATPLQFFWTSGLLSSFLDNAPTYLAFVATAVGRCYPGMPETEAIARLAREHPNLLAAISTGAVFMGANTYIGNAPNFMVKAIAEEAGVPMPSFFGYVLRYSLPVLVVLFLVLSYVFYA